MTLGCWLRGQCPATGSELTQTCGCTQKLRVCTPFVSQTAGLCGSTQTGCALSDCFHEASG